MSDDQNGPALHAATKCEHAPHGQRVRELEEEVAHLRDALMRTEQSMIEQMDDDARKINALGGSEVVIYPHCSQHGAAYDLGCRECAQNFPANATGDDNGVG